MRISRLGAVLLLVLAAPGARAQLIVPPFITRGNHQNDPLIHDGFLDATLYGADPTGATDSTAAIQQAINDGRDYALTTYLPAGTYLISDTLLGFEKLGDPACAQTLGNYGVNMPNEPYVNQAAQAPSLVGPPNGARALLKLADHSGGFDDPANPKPAIHMVNLYPDGGNAGYEGNNFPWSVGNYDCLFYAVVRDVDLQLGRGNSGAVGVQMYSAQMSYMENVSVDATGAYAGIEGSPATSDWINLAVTGGQYGILIDNGGGACSLPGVTLSGQGTAGIAISGCSTTTVPGFDIQETGAPAVLEQWYADTGQTNNVALVDGTITVTGANQPAIVNQNGNNLLIQNVYVQATGPLVETKGQADVAGSGNVDLITEYVHTDTSTPAGTWKPAGSDSLVNGTVGQQDISQVQLSVGTPAPTDFVIRHLPGPLPWIGDAGAVDATAYGADPLGTNDSTAGIQAAIDATNDVFLPRGDYQISGPITLKPNTRLFGVPGMRTGLYGPNWSPHATFLPFVQTANSATAKTYVGDLNFQLPDNVSSATTGYDQSYLYALEWQAGRSSIVNQIGINLDYDNNTATTAARHLINVTQNGGGRFYGVQASELGGNARDDNTAFRFFMAQGTHAPITLYGPNFEHSSASAFMEVSGATNVRVMATKTECSSSWEAIDDQSSNIELTGVDGDWSAQPPNPGVLVESSSDVLLTNLSWFANETNPGEMVEEIDDAGSTKGLPYADAVSVFQIGTFNESPFPHCGDGTCDGAETSANCPSDCGGSAGATSGTGTRTGSSTSSSSSSGGQSWTACLVDGGTLDWSVVPSLFIPYTDAVIQSNAPIAPASNAVLSAEVQTAFDSKNLYVQVVVTDPSGVNARSAPPYYDNAVELYVDGADSRLASFGPGDLQLVISSDGRTFGFPDSGIPESGITASIALADGGFTALFTLPFSALGENPGRIGFDVAIDDNLDGGSIRTSQLVWTGGGSIYTDPQLFGTLTLDPVACGVASGSTTGGTTGVAATGGTSGSPNSSGGCGCRSSTDNSLTALGWAALLVLYGRWRRRAQSWKRR